MASQAIEDARSLFSGSGVFGSEDERSQDSSVNSDDDLFIDNREEDELTVEDTEGSDEDPPLKDLENHFEDELTVEGTDGDCPALVDPESELERYTKGYVLKDCHNRPLDGVDHTPSLDEPSQDGLVKWFRGSKLPIHKSFRWVQVFLAEEAKFPGDYFAGNRRFKQPKKCLVGAQWDTRLNAYIKVNVPNQSPPPQGSHPANCFWVPAISGWRVTLEHTVLEEAKTAVPEFTACPGEFGIGEDAASAFPLMWLSITICSPGSNIPDGWFDLMVTFFERHFLEVSMSLETGGRQKYKHLQCAASTYCPSDQKKCYAMIRKAIKLSLYVGTGDPCNICVKYVKPNDELFVVGYTLKDWGKATFRNFNKGLRSDWMAAARMKWMRSPSSTGKNKASITPSNVVDNAFLFYKHELSPMPVPTLATVVKMMIQSDGYYLSTAFLTRKFDMNRAEQLFTAVHSSAGVSNHDIAQIMDADYTCRDSDVWEQMTYDEAVDQVKQTRHATSYIGQTKNTEDGVVIGSQQVADTETNVPDTGVLSWIDDSKRADGMDSEVEYVSLPRNRTPHVPFTSSLRTPHHLSYQGSEFLISRAKGRTDPEWHKEVKGMIEDANLG